jgi:hypothetical protein
MSAAAHTPGPWSTGGHDIKAQYGNILVGCVFHMLQEGGSQDKEAIANARLIAAAPDMLAALKMLREIDDAYGFDLDEPQRDQMHDAITKAEGLS